MSHQDPDVFDKVILGINDSHDAAAAIVHRGRILCALSEERVQRIKSAGGFPLGAVDACLAETGLTRKDIDYVAVAGTRTVPVNMLGTLSTFGIADHLRIQEEKRLPLYYEGRRVPMRDLFPDYKPKCNVHYPLDRIPLKESTELSLEERRDVEALRLSLIADWCGVSQDRVLFFDHHSCHAYYAYYASAWRDRKVTTLTLDGGGDGIYDSVNEFGADGAFKRIHSSHECVIGKMYSFITLLLGMRPNEEEYKVMGLAPYAREHKRKKTRDTLLDYMSLEGVKFTRNKAIKDLFFHTRDALKGERFDGIAGGLQEFAEHFLTRWVDAAAKAAGSPLIAFGGGVAQNVKVNKLIAELSSVDNLFVPPGPGDESLALGAAWLLMDQLDPSGRHRNRIEPLANGYLGPGFGAADIRAFMEHPAVKGRYVPRNGDPDALASEALANGGIVALCRGRMEFGPRALGHRSLLANPSRAETVDQINEAIKGRDFWMPFAPSVMAEHVDEYLVNPGKADLSYMTVCLDSTEKGQKAMPAGLHLRDKTARVHAVHRTAAPDYHHLLSQFRERTGCAALLNTSLNIHGKPIVNKPFDLAEELLSVDWVKIDHALVGDTFVSKA